MLTRIQYLQWFLDSPPDTDECVEWPFALTVKGQAMLRTEDGTTTAGRIILGLTKGDGMVARHTCDEPCCINPRHLVAGTPQDNSDDMIQRGRLRGSHGQGFKSLRYVRPSERTRP